MINRWLVFAACLFVGSVPGLWAASGLGLVAGLLVAAFAWLAIDSFYVSRLLRWLRGEQNNDIPASIANTVPRLSGVWGETADRVRRLLKDRDHQYRESQARLDEFLAALHVIVHVFHGLFIRAHADAQIF